MVLYEQLKSEGNELFRKRKIKQAEDKYLEAIKTQPAYWPALYNLGALYMYVKDYGKAVNCFDQAVKINPGDPEIAHALGCALAGKGDINAAINEFSRAIKLNKEDPRNYVNRANLNLRLGLSTAAINDCDQVLKKEPFHGSARRIKEYAVLLKDNSRRYFEKEPEINIELLF